MLPCGMPRKRVPILAGERYHVCNRGVERRNVTLEGSDSNHFLQAFLFACANTNIDSFQMLRNSKEKLLRDFEPISYFGRKLYIPKDPITIPIAFTLNPNHHHLLLESVIDGGVSQTLQRLGGYTSYFNTKYDRTGALFQGRSKIIHVDSDDYLLHLSVYAGRNDRVHGIGADEQHLVRTSWPEYESGERGICKKEAILEHFKGPEEYRAYAEAVLLDIRKHKQMERDARSLGLDD